MEYSEAITADAAPIGASTASEAAARGLEPRIAEVCGQLNVLSAELSRLVGEAAATGAWQGHGIRSLAQWVQWQTGLTGSNVHQLVALAAARETHPRITECFDDGRLSVDQAAIAVECEPGDDAEFAELATVLTIPQLRSAVRAANPPEPKPKPDDHESVTMGPNRHGMWECTLRLHLDRGAVFEAALAAMRDELFRDGVGDVTWADAAVELANRGLDSTAAARRERFRINVFIDFDPDTGEPTATWSNGARVPDAIRDLLGCDGDVTPITRIGGYPVNVGRTQRIVPDRTRRIVEHRDQKCRVPWCPNSRWLQIHHIIHWTGDHGPTETWNLAALCPRLPPPASPRRVGHHRQRRPPRRTDLHRPPRQHHRPGHPAGQTDRATAPTTPPLPTPRRRTPAERRPPVRPTTPHPPQLGTLTSRLLRRQTCSSRPSSCIRSIVSLREETPSLR